MQNSQGSTEAHLRPVNIYAQQKETTLIWESLSYYLLLSPRAEPPKRENRKI